MTKMDKSEYLNKLHGDILDIMDYIDDLCKKNQLKYYLIGGSLLGAVRHSGFIPWDDDLDIVMPREDFNKFVDLCQSHKMGNVYLRWVTTEKYYWQLFAKMCLKNTVFHESSVESGKTSGIFVDIFPLDSCDGYDWKMKVIKPFVSFCKTWLYKQSRGRSALSSSFIHSLFLKITSLLKSRTNTHYAMFGSAYPIWKQTFKKEWLGEGTIMEFSGRKYLCPSNSHEVLKLTFGDDYMSLPSEEKRITHSPVRVVFKDGTEFVPTSNF